MKEFHCESNNEKNKELKIDNGLEFCFKEFDEFVKMKSL